MTPIHTTRQPQVRLHKQQLIQLQLACQYADKVRARGGGLHGLSRRQLQRKCEHRYQFNAVLPSRLHGLAGAELPLVGQRRAWSLVLGFNLGVLVFF